MCPSRHRLPRRGQREYAEVSTMRTVLCLLACLAVACHSPKPRSAHDVAKIGPSTKLTRDGCSVELVGSWRLDEASRVNGGWSATRLDGDESLTVLATPWKAQTLATEWREDLAAVIELRLDAEKQAGTEASISEPAYRGDGEDPGAFYTSLASSAREGSLTFVKASPTLLCLFVLAGPFTDRDGLFDRAQRLLPKAHARP